MYSLRVVQQPERARLCSFKEENETSESLFTLASNDEGPSASADDLVDRRPVDPPPVVELLLDNVYVFLPGGMRTS